MPAVEIFRALGDPIRLEIVRRLSSGPAYTLTSVSSGLGITRQGARRHLAVLQEAKLIELAPKGRDVAVSLTPASLETAKAFIATLEKRWGARLESLKTFVEASCVDELSG